MIKLSTAPTSDKIKAFDELCKAESRLYVVGLKSLQDAVDRCQQFAEAWGLIEETNQDSIQLIMAKAFGDRPGGPPKKQVASARTPRTREGS